MNTLREFNSSQDTQIDDAFRGIPQPEERTLNQFTKEALIREEAIRRVEYFDGKAFLIV